MNRDNCTLSARTILQYFLKSLTFVPAILVAVMIFGFSSQNAAESSELSSGLTQEIVEFVNVHMNRGWSVTEQAALVMHLEHYIRKLAHFAEYALLGFTLAIPMYTYRIRRWKLPVSAGLICFLYAMLDEFHQNFSNGRSPQFTDVLLDTCGAVTGVLIGWLIAHIFARTIFQPLSLKKGQESRHEQKKEKCTTKGSS